MPLHERHGKYLNRIRNLLVRQWDRAHYSTILLWQLRNNCRNSSDGTLVAFGNASGPFLPKRDEGCHHGPPERDRHIDPREAILGGPRTNRHGTEQIVPEAEDLAVIAVVAGPVRRMMDGVEHRADDDRINPSIAPF